MNNDFSFSFNHIEQREEREEMNGGRERQREKEKMFKEIQSLLMESGRFALTQPSNHHGGLLLFGCMHAHTSTHTQS